MPITSEPLHEEERTMKLITGTTHHWFVVTGNDLPGTVGDIGITPGTTYWYEVVTMSDSGKEGDDNGGKCYSLAIPKS
jgi:hypothetical protein